MPKDITPPIKIGCELIIRKGNGILFGLRKNHYGAGTWGLPSGHLEFGERLFEAACREAHEELGVVVKADDLRLISVVDDVEPQDDRHYIHVSFELLEPKWEPRNAEPEYCAALKYFSINSLPEHIFPPHQAIIRNYLEKRLYSFGPDV